MDSSGLSCFVIFLVVAIYLGAVVLSHFCILSQSLTEIKKRLRDEDEENHSSDKILAKLLENSPRLILSVQLTEGICAMLLGIFVAFPIATKLIARLALRLLALGKGYALFWGAFAYVIPIVIAILLSLAMIVLCELLPKIIIAKKDEDKLATRLAPFMNFVYCLCYPLTIVAELLARLLAKILGEDSYEAEKSVTEEEIRMMVDAGNEKGAIEQSERDMIDNIFEFDDNEVQRVMTHRTEMVTLQKDMTVTQAVKIAVEEGYSRLPVYDEDIDDIVGILYVKDLLTLVGKESAHKETIDHYLREAIFVPESKRCDDLFKIFKAKKIQIAIVVDEYGGTSGLVSMEDLLEAIVGNIQDEYDDEEELTKILPDGRFIFDGSIDIEEFSKLTDYVVPEEYEDCETLGGLITDILGRIPKEKEKPKIILGNITLTVTKIEDRRIAKVFCQVKPEEDEKEKRPFQRDRERTIE